MLACIDIGFLEQVNTQLATLEAFNQQMQSILTPVQNFSVSPGPEARQAVLLWEHPMGDRISYEIFFADQPINEDNWLETKRFTIESQKIQTEEGNGTIKMSYVWQAVPLKQKQWVVVRQTVKGMGELEQIFETVGPSLGINIPGEMWQLPPSVMQPSNMVSIIDTGFRPDPDGFSRKNNIPPLFYPSVSPSDYVQMLRSLFGDIDICSVVIAGKCLPRKSTITIRKQLYFGGQCSGFSTSSGLIFTGKLDIKDYASFSIFRKPKTIALGHSKKVNDLIMSYQVLQIQEKIYLGDRVSSSELNAEVFANLLESTLMSYVELPNLMTCVWNIEKEKPVCHSVLPFFAVSDGMSAAESWVYDSNHPKSNSQRLRVDFTNQTWEYNFSGSSTWNGTYTDSRYKTGWTDLHSISMYEDTKTGAYINKAPWRHVEDIKKVFVGEDIKLSITSSSGAMIGYGPEGSLINEISGANFSVFDEEGNHLFVLPDDDYQFVVNSAVNNDQSVLIFSSDSTYALESLTSGDHFYPEDNSLTYGNNLRPANAKISIIVEEDYQSSLLRIQPELVAGNQIKIHYDAPTLDFYLTSDDPFTYGVDMEVTNADGEFYFHHEDLQYSPGSTILLQPEDVTRDDEDIIIGIDTNDDGFIDQQLQVENQYDPENQTDPEIAPEIETEPGDNEKSIFPAIMILIAISLILIIIILLVAKQRKKAKLTEHESNNYYDF